MIITLSLKGLNRYSVGECEKVTDRIFETPSRASQNVAAGEQLSEIHVQFTF